MARRKEINSDDIYGVGYIDLMQNSIARAGGARSFVLDLFRTEDMITAGSTWYDARFGEGFRKPPDKTRTHGHHLPFTATAIFPVQGTKEPFRKAAL